MWGRVERRGVGHQHGQQRHDVLRQPRHHRGEDERRRSMAPPSEWCRQEQSPSQRTKEGAAAGGGMRQSTNGGRTGCSAAGVSCAYASQVLTAWTVVVGGTERA